MATTLRGHMQDGPLTIDSIFRYAARHFPDKTITTNRPDGPVTATYAQWAERTRRIAGSFDRLGLTAGARVGTFAWNSADHLALYYAAPGTGRVLHTLNIRLFDEQNIFVVNHAEDEAIFVDASLLAALGRILPRLESVRHVVVMDDGSALSDEASEVLRADSRVVTLDELLADAEPRDLRTEDELAASAMCYTSGTTGNPKAVVYTHRSIVLHAMSVIQPNVFGLSERDVCLPVVPQFHANAWGICHAAPMVGSSMAMAGPLMTPQAIADLIVNQGVTFTAGVPTIWQGTLPHLIGREHRLRMVACGGSAVPKALSEAYRTQVGVPGGILQAWGMTETSPVAATSPLASRYDGSSTEVQAAQRARTGVPPFGVDIRIVEVGTTEELPWDDAATGELQVRGPWCAQQYYQADPGVTLLSADGWMMTGDIASIDEFGSIRIADRTKDLIKSGGEWISSVDLENALMAHPAIAEAAVIAIPDDKWGERPLACVVVADGQSVSVAELVTHLEPLVAAWWIPERFEFIDEVPKTSVGKFSKKDLRARFRDE